MKVNVGGRLYQMGYEEYESLLALACEQVPFGIYALEKKDYAELRCDKCGSITQLKNLSRGFRRQGFKVRANGR